MASTRKKSTKKAGKTSAKRPAPAKGVEAKTKGDSVRVMPSERLIIDLSNEMDKTLERSSVLSGAFGQTMKAAVEKGVNNIAFRLVKRIHRMAQRDPLKAAITVEDFQYYYDVLGLDKTLAKSMFPAAETRSGKKSAATKAKGKNGDDKQTAMPLQPTELPPPEGSDDAPSAVH